MIEVILIVLSLADCQWHPRSGCSVVQPVGGCVVTLSCPKLEAAPGGDLPIVAQLTAAGRGYWCITETAGGLVVCRPDLALFTDGFESGGPGAWSRVVGPGGPQA